MVDDKLQGAMSILHRGPEPIRDVEGALDLPREVEERLEDAPSDYAGQEGHEAVARHGPTGRRAASIALRWVRPPTRVRGAELRAPAPSRTFAAAPRVADAGEAERVATNDPCGGVSFRDAALRPLRGGSGRCLNHRDFVGYRAGSPGGLARQ